MEKIVTTVLTIIGGVYAIYLYLGLHTGNELEEYKFHTLWDFFGIGFVGLILALIFKKKK